ncbi:MAG: leucine-rich repeat protein [Muribaculaceae bacterium]|nr:leucine-rich repeat protein [Muribaculaceae bacterium]
MKAYNIILLTLFGAAALGSCSDELTVPVAGGAASAPIRLSAAYPVVSRASDAGFDDGDRMGVYVLDYDNDQVQDMTDAAVRARNIRFRFSEADNSWNGAAEIYWRDEQTPADIIAYYPYDSALSEPSAMRHSVARRQDTERSATEPGGYEASDLLRARAVRIMPTAEKVNLTFGHLMAGVRVCLVEGSGFADGEWSGLERNVLVSGVVPGGIVNLADGTVAADASGTAISITPLEYNGEYRAVVFPQTVAAGVAVVAINVGGDSYMLRRDSDMHYVQGKMHSFTITVDKKSDGGLEFSLESESISQWIDENEFRDGIIRQYVTVDVPRRGGLADAVKELGLDPARIYNLKLRGEINHLDYDYIRGNIVNLNAVNLYETVSYAEDKADEIPDRAFEEMRTLRHVIFPGKLRRIGGWSFRATGLTGDLVIPEGVVSIGSEAFQSCGTLVGSLTLPSTLESIDWNAFGGASLSGNLTLPQKLRTIGPSAFGGCRFTGELHLPDGVESIGSGAFSSVKFTGSLTIPPSLTVIEPLVFSECTFSGTLQLPQGLTEVGAAAFRGCSFKGELALPSSLRRIDSEAFQACCFSSVVLPEKLVFLGNNAFADCSRLSGTLNIPEGITFISHCCFSGCTLLSGIVLPESITTIEGGAFMNCYNLTSIVSHNPEPPLLRTDRYDSSFWFAFEGVPKDNFTVQVPEQSVEAYRSALGWSGFRRISAYRNFVCRPSMACALGTAHEETLVLNADASWTVSHKPDWVRLSVLSGNGKTELRLSFEPMAGSGGKRSDYIEFTLEDGKAVTRCDLNQYAYEYGEDECVVLQRATRGRGIDVLFVGEGFDASAIASGDYMRKVGEQMEYFFGIEPYTSYREYFNVYACVSLSQETGINTDNNYFNSRFGALYTSGNLMLDNADMVWDYAVEKSPLTRERMPQSLIVVALNSDEYGSATLLSENGSAIAMVCGSSDPYPMDSRGVFQHEACGHAFGKLGEERINATAYLSSSERQAIERARQRGWYANLSLNGMLSDVPWSHFIFDPRYSDKVDVFEGGYGKSRGCFRAEINSCMNYGIPYFSAAARQDIVRRILDYSGEGFSMEKFYALDNDNWGSSARSATETQVPVQSAHNPLRVVKSKKY